MPSHIPVRHIPSSQDITVQRGYFEFVREECNHAGAEEVELCSDPGGDRETITKGLQCDKCYAIYNEVDQTWD